MAGRVAWIAAALISIPAGIARAQSAPSCSFEAGTLTVMIDGISATLTASGAGAIELDGVPCGQATTTATDLIQVNGGALADKLTLTGSFAPGATAEPSGTSEIEILLALGAGSDTLAVKYGNTADTVTFTASGVDVGGDGDEDLTTAGVEVVSLMTSAGDDTIDARAYLGGGLLVVDGGDGADVLYGSAVRDRLLGDAGNDILYGGGADDTLIGGDGDDVLRGGADDDRMVAGAAVDGADRFHGGGGHDTVDYSARTSPVSVTPSSSDADDGQPGVEFDRVALDVEEIEGGVGDDDLTYDDATGPVVLRGNRGSDVIRGGPFGDALYGGPGADALLGGLGDDLIYGEGGQDWLYHEFTSVGFDGNDLMSGGSGIDTVSYYRRSVGVTLTLGNDLADDGTPGVEFDTVGSDVENAIGSAADDVLVGSEAPNELIGLNGNDEIYGSGGDDRLLGSFGNDLLVGDAGDDLLKGENGQDTLDGGDGDDVLRGGPSSDTLDGGAGVDQYLAEGGNDTLFNGDGIAETVDCGDGTTDDAEPDPADSFIGCEL
jgi:Ca2+-binding RTX toxin-like protein